jgi:hypothetical protein
MIKRVVIIVIILTAFAGAIAYTLYTQKHRMIEKESYISISAPELFKAFEENESLANTKYLNQVIEVTGILSEVLANQENNTVVILQSSDPLFGVSCTLEHPAINLSAGDSIVLKGICTGYLSDVVLTHCVLITP